MFQFSFLSKVINRCYSIFFYFFYAFSFRNFGRKVRLLWPDAIQGEKYIGINDQTVICTGVWLLALKNDEYDPRLEIGKNTYIGRYCHIVSVREVIIEDSVLIADKVYISDNLHEYRGIHVPIKDQPVIFKKSVRISEGAWLGENVCVIGASVGKNSVVAANSVVTKDVPDYTVVAGAPARVIKKFNFDSQSWESI